MSDNRITRFLDTDELLAAYEDHKEIVYLGNWKVLTVGRVKLIRREDGMIEVEELEDEEVI